MGYQQAEPSLLAKYKTFRNWSVTYNDIHCLSILEGLFSHVNLDIILFFFEEQDEQKI